MAVTRVGLTKVTKQTTPNGFRGEKCAEVGRKRPKKRT